MPRFEVQLDERIKHVVEVDADNEEVALEKAYQIIMNGPDSEYATDSEGISASYVYEIK